MARLFVDVGACLLRHFLATDDVPAAAGACLPAVTWQWLFLLALLIRIQAIMSQHITFRVPHSARYTIFSIWQYFE
jgi:hypothetical protein